jgi:ketosteroid isomerase-like protein
VKVSFSEVQTLGDQGLATVSAIVTYAAESAQGEPLRSMQNRMTWVLRETGHVFRIVHEHTSAPIGFEDSKPSLRVNRPR